MISWSARRRNQHSAASQNETAKECYQLGFFAPRNADAALAALEMMDFEGIEKVRQRVRQNGTLAQRLEQLQSQLVQLKQGPLSGPGENLSTAAAARAMTSHLRNPPAAELLGAPLTGEP